MLENISSSNKDREVISKHSPQAQSTRKTEASIFIVPFSTKARETDASDIIFRTSVTVVYASRLNISVAGPELRL